ncbi:MAG TPA: DUF5916 domain-containing protein [Chitinophagaceae bacterium]|nr:DUF5916 domain-containing protein [Chitinophagaceae bacterium]
MLRTLTCLSLFLCFIHSINAQEKTIRAVKTAQPPRIDGTLDDAAWATAPVAGHFIQNYPNAGQPASQRTEVRLLYDDNAVYVGAYLYDNPALVRRQITARDEEQQKDLDFFSVFFDTYHDSQNGFQFLVTSANVQTDARLSPSYTAGFGEYGDKTWDAVWHSRVGMKSDGWVVEMRIPFFSIRFSKDSIQNWGIQFLRSVRRNNESSFWNPVDPQVNGFVNQFGILQNLVNLRPPLRLSFSPYVSGGVSRIPTAGGHRTEWLKNGGMDVKYGINESFTLDATLVPDFGQVISDNVINNLTPYEVRFVDYRPFFTEGPEIFNKAGLFYSRRIGDIPSGHFAVQQMADANPDMEIIKNPARTQLINAIKLSGRTSKKLGIGVFNAVTAPMHAVVEDKTTGERTRIQTEPLANYNILVLDQALRGRSYVTLTNTNVLRNGSHRDANVTGLNFSLYNKANVYNLRGSFDYSKVFGANPYDGYAASLKAGKVSGLIQYFASSQVRSSDYDPTDLGYITTANEVINNAEIAYRRFTPGKNFINYNYTLRVIHSQLYKPGRFNYISFEGAAFWIFKNFWDVSVSLSYLPDQHDYYVLGRPFDKYARRPQYGFIELEGSTDSRKRLFASYNFLLADFFKNPEKEYYRISGSVRYRFSNKFSLELSSRYETETDYIISAGRDMANEPRMAFVDFKENESILSGIYNFTPRINLTLRARHYWSHVPVKRVAYIDDKGMPVSPVAVTGNTMNVNYFNTDAFLTWDFRYGSRLIIGYKNWLGENDGVDGLRYKRYFNNLEQQFQLRHGNEVTVRFIYFLDYNQLRRKK